jgi:4,5-dihydroxyphthalate decarboxylase
MATADYEHLRDLTCGKVRADGIDLNALEVTAREAFHRFTRFAEFDVAEMPLGRHLSFLSRGNERWVAIPVFPSRRFGLAALFVRADGPVDKPEDLAGRRIGVPAWTHTASIYLRGWLSDYLDIPLEEIRWFQAGPREETGEPSLPRALELSAVPQKSLEQLLLEGEIDALICAGAPDPLLRQGDRLRRLIAEPRATEEKYWKDTGIFPILTTVVIRRDIFDANRWVALNLYEAFVQAKDNALKRLSNQGIAKFPMPWGSTYAEAAQQRFGKDYWPYGVAANRSTLEAFCTFAHEQGVCARKLAPEELFPREVQDFA